MVQIQIRLHALGPDTRGPGRPVAGDDDDAYWVAYVSDLPADPGAPNARLVCELLRRLRLSSCV